MLDSESLSRWVVHAAHDPNGTRIGDLIHVYRTAARKPRWLMVKRGAFTTCTDLVPASTASVGRPGLKLSLDGARIQGAPRVRDRRHLSDEDERALTDYYGLGVAS
jgi:hypothetical protein